MDFLGELASAVRPRWQGRYVVLAEKLDGAATSLVREARSCGGQVIGVIVANRPGSARVPGDLQVLSLATDDSVVSRAEFARCLAQAPPRLEEFLDSIDPERTSELIATNFIELTTVAARAVVGARPPRWAAYEDKTIIDTLFHDLGIDTPPAAVLPADSPELVPRMRELSCGLGCILALDSSTDYRGDSLGLRWLQPHMDRLEEVAAWAAERASRVRIATFCEGVPCSVLGMVAATGVAVFDPIEIVTLRTVGSHTLTFVGWSNFWRPPEEAVVSLRDAARRVGQRLARMAEYRGFFSIDGILSADGFLATEVNPRLASGLGLRQIAPEFPIYLFSRSLQHDTDLFESVDADAFESSVRRMVANEPSFSLRLPLTPAMRRHLDARAEVVGRPVAETGVVYRRTDDDVVIVEAQPAGPRQLLGPVVAELGKMLGCEGLTCYQTMS